MQTSDVILEYVRMMNEIKARMNFIRLEFASRSENLTVQRFDQMDPILRFVGTCLQLRKILELVVLSCLVTRGKRLEEQRRFLRKENDLRKIVTKLAAISPFDGKFLPISVRKPSKGQPVRSAENDKQLCSKVLEDCYGKLGDILHSRNPIQKPSDIRGLQSMHASVCAQLIAAMRYHTAPLHDGKLLLTYMNGSREAVTCCRLNPKELEDV